MDIKVNGQNFGFKGAIKVPKKNFKEAEQIISTWGGDSSEYLNVIRKRSHINIRFLKSIAESSALEHLKTERVSDYVYWNNSGLTEKEFKRFARSRLYSFFAR